MLVVRQVSKEKLVWVVVQHIVVLEGHDRIIVIDAGSGLRSIPHCLAGITRLIMELVYVDSKATCQFCITTN